MKNDIKELRPSPEDVLPNMLVVECEDPEQYVEQKGLDVASEITSISTDISLLTNRISRSLKDNLSIIADKDIDRIKEIASQLKAMSITLTEMATTYDEIPVYKTASKSLKKLLSK